MIADEDAYQFFIPKDSDLFFPKDAFDNKHGIMDYNCTDQEKGRVEDFIPVIPWTMNCD